VRRAGPVLLAAAVLMAGATPAWTGNEPSRPEVSWAVRHDTSPPLRRLARAEPTPAPAAVQVPGFNVGDPERSERAPVRDPLVRPAPRRLRSPPPSRSFDGLTNADNIAVTGRAVLPPDPTGDVGPNHYVQWVNVTFRVWTKDGAPVTAPIPGNGLWAGFGGLCEASNQGDPIVLYDELANRWFLSQLAFTVSPGSTTPLPPFHQCIAVSATPDPAGPLHRYDFEWSTTRFNDYPKFGVWPDGYYMSANQFENPGTVGAVYAGPGVAAFDRAAMLAGLPAAMIKFELGATSPGAISLLPSDLDGSNPPPPGAPNAFMNVRDPTFEDPAPQGLNVWEFHADFANPTASSVSGPTPVTLEPFDINLCDFEPDCIPQPATDERLHAISGFLMHRLAYRNFGRLQAVVGTFTVDVGADHAGIRWFELRRSGGGWTVRQQGTHAPDELHRWMGSIAMDQGRNIALGYSVSGPTTFPSIAYAARDADDPHGALQAEVTLMAGSGSQTASQSRWGDYTTMSVDPNDDRTFWYTNEYYPVTSNNGWNTRIGSFGFPPVRCRGAPATIEGIDEADVLVGTPGRDVIAGGGGNDRINGLGGNDLICGGDGNDRIRGGPGNDRVQGEDGNDALLGGPGKDTLLGGRGRDTCRAGPGVGSARQCER
jgi:hypothetical protein